MMTAPLPDLTSTDACWASVNAAFEQAANSARHPFHVLTVATIGLDGHPEARTVVLRRHDPAGRSLWFHTDGRSPKVAQLRRDPRLTLLAYHPADRWQVRLHATATLHEDDREAEAAWLTSRPDSRACYGLEAPGTRLPWDAPVKAPPPIEADDREAFAHFVAVACHYTVIDVLVLSAAGHQRVRLTWHERGWLSERLAP